MDVNRACLIQYVAESRCGPGTGRTFCNFFLFDVTFQLFQQNDLVVTFWGPENSKSLQRVANRHLYYNLFGVFSTRPLTIYG